MSELIQVVRKIKDMERRLSALEAAEFSSMNNVIVARASSDAGTQTVATTTVSIINFEDVEYDSHSAITVGSSWKFTAPKAGYYHVEALISYALSTDWQNLELSYLYLYKDDASHSLLHRKWDLDSTSTAKSNALGGSVDVYMEQGSYISLRVIHQSGATQTLFNDAKRNWVTIHSIKLD